MSALPDDPEDFALRARVKLLGQLLGQVISRHAGAEVYDVVEELRTGFIALRDEDPDAPSLDALLARIEDLDGQTLTEVVRGNLTLFMRNDELEAAWRWVDPILAAWADSGEAPKGYTAGSWGPSSAVSLLARAGHAWHEDADSGD